MVTSGGSQWVQLGCKLQGFDISIGPGESRRLVLGVTGSIRFTNLLRFKMRPPSDLTDDPMAYLSTDFAEEVHRVLTDGKSIDSNNGRDESDSAGLIAYVGRLFRISTDFSVTEPDRRFDAVGSGHELALGAIHALGIENPRAAVEAALAAASEIDPWTGGPVTLEEVA
jgi:hypothetical protein